MYIYIANDISLFTIVTVTLLVGLTIACSSALGSFLGFVGGYIRYFFKRAITNKNTYVLVRAYLNKPYSKSRESINYTDLCQYFKKISPTTFVDSGDIRADVYRVLILNLVGQKALVYKSVIETPETDYIIYWTLNDNLYLKIYVVTPK